ncbi:MAG: hypothetical protein LUC41_01140 [Clostridiales bacterium]|nr:hypothetical protein [Clostridiales bacterium]
MRKIFFRQRFFSGKLVFAVLLVFALCFCSTFMGDAEGKTMFQALFCYSKEELASMGEGAAAYMGLMGFRDSEWFPVLLPVLVSFPWVYDFTGQWFSGNYYLAVSRMSRKTYALRTMIRAAGTGFFILAAGVLLYAACLWICFPHYSTNDPAVSALAMTYGATVLQRAAYFIKSLLHTGLLAALLAMLSVVLAVVLKDRFLALTLPVLAGYMSVKLSAVCRTAGHAGGNSKGGGLVMFLFPSEHLYYDRLFAYSFGLSYGFYLFFLVVMAVLLTGLLMCWVNRRND